MTLSDRIDSLLALGKYLGDLNSDALNDIKHRAQTENQWFTQANIDLSLSSIRDQFLTSDALHSVVNKYKIDDNIIPKGIGLVLAGNIPLVGFHDILCCYLVGHRSIIKYSEKDKTLTQHLIQKIIASHPEAKYYFEEVNRLTEYDAVIATGSNTTAKQFEIYFSHVPHIIRRNRNSIAVLQGNETPEEMDALGKDVFEHFGLGCRNVSTIFLPTGYDIAKLFDAFDTYKDIIHHNKYKNNYDYNLALSLLNKDTFLHNDMLILKESEQIISRIASLHYQFYEDAASLQLWIHDHQNEIQCIVTHLDLQDLKTVKFGMAQCPSILDFADDVDTIQFLLAI